MAQTLFLSRATPPRSNDHGLYCAQYGPSYPLGPISRAIRDARKKTCLTRLCVVCVANQKRILDALSQGGYVEKQIPFVRC